MSIKKNFFPNVSLLITHYNRPESLNRLLNHFSSINCEFGEIVVSDDCSTPENINELNKLKLKYNFNLITTAINKGLGNNINKGQDAVSKTYTLYVQEDFIPKDLFSIKLQQSLELLSSDANLDVVRYYAYQKFPKLKPVKYGFSQMIFNGKNILSSYKKFYAYSDHPHLRRSNFLRKFGEYKEGVNVEKAEYSMMMSFLKKNGKGLFYEKYNDLFEQINTNDEPSTFKRNWKRESNSLGIKMIRHLYRHLKFNFDYHF